MARTSGVGRLRDSLRTRAEPTRHRAFERRAFCSVQKIISSSLLSRLLAPLRWQVPAQMHFRSKGQGSTRFEPSGRHPTADRAPSTAWLAAQEAFSAPKPVPIEHVVVVERKESLLPAPTPSLEPPATVATPVPAAKAARVFRVVSQAADAGVQPEVSDVQTDETSQARAALATSAAPAVRQRVRRLHPSRQPGPVMHIVQAERPSTARAEAPPTRHLSHREQAGVLQVLMGELAAVLDDAVRARAFRFED